MSNAPRASGAGLRSDETGRPWTRRRCLRTAGAIAAVPIAGCSVLDGSGDGDASQHFPERSCEPEEYSFHYFRYGVDAERGDVGECKAPDDAMKGSSRGSGTGSVSATVSFSDASYAEFSAEEIRIHDGSGDGPDDPTVDGVLSALREASEPSYTETSDRYDFVTDGTRAFATGTEPIPDETVLAYPHPNGVVSARVPGVDVGCPYNATIVYRAFVQSHRPR